MQHKERRDKYEKNVYVYWVDTAYIGEYEQKAEDQLQQETEFGEHARDSCDLGLGSVG